MKSRLPAILLIAGSLVLGLLVYYTRRTDDLYINDWLTRLIGTSLKSTVQVAFSGLYIPQQLIYSLPDGLWMLALTISILLIWDFRIHANSLAWIAIVLAAGTGFECLQGFQWIKGWFDPIDLLFIISGTLIPVSYILLKKHLCKLH